MADHRVGELFDQLTAELWFGRDEVGSFVVLDEDPELAARYGTVVDDPASADVSILRTNAPFEPREGAFESRFHSGSLAFGAEELEELLSTIRSGPTVVDVFLERPAVVTPLAEEAAALTGTYGCNDEAYLDAIFGMVAPQGRLPVVLPRSMADVEASPTDVPLRGDGPLFARGRDSPCPDAAAPVSGRRLGRVRLTRQGGFRIRCAATSAVPSPEVRAVATRRGFGPLRGRLRPESGFLAGCTRRSRWGERHR